MVYGIDSYSSSAPHIVMAKGERYGVSPCLLVSLASLGNVLAEAISLSGKWEKQQVHKMMMSSSVCRTLQTEGLDKWYCGGGIFTHSENTFWVLLKFNGTQQWTRQMSPGLTGYEEEIVSNQESVRAS